MGFLHNLWDETLAGPTPETGLGKLRKCTSLSATAPPPSEVVQLHDEGHHIPISRSITVMRTNSNRNLNVSVGSPSQPSSPASSTAPSSPFSPTTPGGNFRKFTRRKAKAWQTSEPESKNVCDWIMILNALDRF